MKYKILSLFLLASVACVQPALAYKVEGKVNYNKRDGNYQTGICIKSKRIHLGYYNTPVEGAIAYNNYIIENNLEGFILNEIPEEYLI